MGANHTSESASRTWVLPAVLIGIGYALVGIVFAFPTTHAQAWRLAAWFVSALAYGAHIVYEGLWRRESSGRAALHVAVAVAIGAFGLAVGANVHSLFVGSTGRHRQLLRLSLAVWPIMTALPAFLVAFVTSVALTRVLGGGRDE